MTKLRCKQRGNNYKIELVIDARWYWLVDKAVRDAEILERIESTINMIDLPDLDQVNLPQVIFRES